jgi:hypothetical protein
LPDVIDHLAELRVQPGGVGVGGDVDVEAEAGRALDNVARCRGADIGRLRPAIPLEKEEHRRLEPCRERERLVERSLAQRPVTELCHRDGVLATASQRPRIPHGDGRPAALDARREEALVAEVLRPASAQAERPLPAHHLGHERIVGAAVGQVMAVSAMRREEDIDALSEVRVQRRRAQLLTDTGVHRSGEQTVLEELQQHRFERADAQRHVNDSADIARERGDCRGPLHLHPRHRHRTSAPRRPLSFTPVARRTIRTVHSRM